MAENAQAEEQPKKYKLKKPLHYKGELIDPEVVKDAEVELYLDQVPPLQEQGVI